MRRTVLVVVGTVVLQVPPLLVEYCTVEPVGQEAWGRNRTAARRTAKDRTNAVHHHCGGACAVKTGQGGHVPGAVVTVLVGLETCGFASQLQRVKTVCAGPSWSYVGTVVLQVPPLLVEYQPVQASSKQGRAGMYPAPSLPYWSGWKSADYHYNCNASKLSMPDHPGRIPAWWCSRRLHYSWNIAG
ncbi:MAG: hypothetical protein IPL27_06525 [Lewinellaceae bacterium]|nr:hypothetical protein [Lewinellaceae bacterium]